MMLDLWDYRQALYADAAKWVSGDVGSRYQKARYDMRGDVDMNQRMANAHYGHTPGTYAGLSYRLAKPRNGHLGWGQ